MESVTVGADAAVIVILVEADIDVLVTDVAVIVTVLLTGTVEGAMNVVGAPLAVAAALKLPHALLLLHVTLQVTPALFESLATLALSDVVAPACNELGVALKEMEMDGGGVVDEPPPPHPASIATAPRTPIKRLV